MVISKVVGQVDSPPVMFVAMVVIGSVTRMEIINVGSTVEISCYHAVLSPEVQYAQQRKDFSWHCTLHGLP